ncbi:MAG TPA: type II toxin-antitoxin system HipA family toxin YjjJ [Gammaproteobacteria bacterium]|jgi:hypothetical protein
MARDPELLNHLLRNGVTPGGELCRALGISPATLSRIIARYPDQILRLGRTRGVRYGAYRSVPGIPSRVPVYRVDGSGEVRPVATLHLLARGEHWLERQDGRGDFFAGLPPVVVDMAPQGYLGRNFGERHAELGLPVLLRDWNDDHRLIAVARRGEDCPGDLILGEESLDRYLAMDRVQARRSLYPVLAMDSAQGGGSSAGGEHPKFTACVEGRQLIVKFTPGDGSPSDRRWRDLLACEALALEVLRAVGIEAARAEILEQDGRRFLEVERFDRVGLRGRRGFLTAGPLDDDLYGDRDNWPALAGRLHRDGLLSAADTRRVRLIDAYGQLIANTDRHFGNIGFQADGLLHAPALHLAPAYDTLPMAFSPRSGIVPELQMQPPRARSGTLEVWQEARGLAAEFWRRVAGDVRISAEFRAAAAGFAQGIQSEH